MLYKSQIYFGSPLQGLWFDDPLFDLIKVSSNIEEYHSKKDVTECGKQEVSCWSSIVKVWVHY